MKKVLIAPHKYVQGPDLFSEIGELLKPLGNRPFFVWDSLVQGMVKEAIFFSCRAAGMDPLDAVFPGEAMKAEAERLAVVAREAGADIAVGVGGGKTLDVAKAIAAWNRIGMVTAPTLASTDSPTSAESVWYNEQGDCMGWDCWSHNPDMVIVDTRVIVCAPVRTFVAGIGDALATWLEAEAAYKCRATAISGGVPTLAAMAMARLCFDTVLEHGVAAKRAAENRVVVPAFEKVVEANTLLSGIGFESGGVATAHAIANALPSLAECHHLYHGEKVGFGIVTQLCLDDEMDSDEMAAIVDFEVAIGLPVTFTEMGLDGIPLGQLREKLRLVADAAAADGSIAHNHPFPVTAETLLDAMLAADAFGRSRKCEE